MTSDDGKLLELLDQIYGMVLDDAMLPSALQSLADFATARGTYCVTVNRQNGQLIATKSVGLDLAMHEEYRTYFGAVDVRIPPCLDVPIGQPITEATALDRREFEASEIYGDFLLRHDIPHIMAFWTQKTAHTISAVSLQRSGSAGSFSDRDQERLMPIIPHLVRALRIRDALQAARTQLVSSMEVLDRLPFAVMFLDETGKLLQASSAAQALLRNEQGICTRRGRVHAALREDDSRLQQAVSRTAQRQLGAGDTLSVRRCDGKRAMSATVIPIRTPPLFMSIVPACMLVVFDPESVPAPAATLVKSALHLTDAEAVLACVLFTGVTLREAAEQLELSINTCKSQLKSIYQKTGCKSHVDLAKTLLMTTLGRSSA